MRNDVLLSAKGLSSHILLFLQELPFEEQPIVLLETLAKKLEENESPRKIRTPRPRISRRKPSDVHSQRRIESMSFDRVTFGKKKVSQKVNGKKKGKVLSPDFISKKKRFEKNERNRKAKPKSKMNKRAWHIASTKKKSIESISLREIDHLVNSRLPLDMVLKKVAS